MKHDKPFIAGLLAVVLISLIAGFLLGSHHTRRTVEREQRAITQAAVYAEYYRVLGAVARTMRCSSEDEYDAGRDHQCTSSEVEQDAGLTIQPCTTDSDCFAKNGSDF
jgi:hypothetical protein